MILLHGTGTHNKGAELMAQAVLEHFRARPGAREFAVPASFGTYRERARYGLWTLLDERRVGRAKLAALLAHRGFRRKYGLAAESDITAVIDASGFAFGDQHGPKPTQAMARRCRGWKRQGKKLVLLPQAFGPFSSAEIRAACREMVDHCHLVFAREETSYRHLVEVAGQRPTIRVAPDFTLTIPGRLPEGFRPADNAAYVVPNQRMLDKTDERTCRNYIPALAQVIDGLAACNLQPVVLLHAPEDAPLATRLAETTRTPFDVITVDSPVELKGILGTGRLVVGSRFHALAGALSQGLPVLALGWSHKYAELLRDFDCPEALLSIDDAQAGLDGKMRPLLESSSRAAIVARLQAAAQRLRTQIERMWVAVDQTLGLAG